MATKFTKNDFDAAEELVEFCMSNLGPLFIGDQQRALEDIHNWLGSDPTEAPTSMASRALEMLIEAREYDKRLPLSDLEHLLFVVCKSAKTIPAAGMKRGHRMADPCKLVFMLLSDRSERWYDNNHKSLLVKLSKV